MIGIGSSVSVTASENLAQVGGFPVNIGPGASGTGTQRVVTASDSTIGTVTTVASITSGNVGGFTAYVSSTVGMSVAGAYATGDYMGISTSPQAFTNVVRTSGGTGIIESLIISDKITTTNVAMELWLFSATFVAPTDNAAWAISDTTGWYANANGQVFSVSGLNYPIKPAATSLFYALVARGTTPSFTSADLTLNLSILQD